MACSPWVGQAAGLPWQFTDKLTACPAYLDILYHFFEMSISLALNFNFILFYFNYFLQAAPAGLQPCAAGYVYVHR
jgi:hypothetical protein